jgi:hypothetical protein
LFNSRGQGKEQFKKTLAEHLHAVAGLGASVGSGSAGGGASIDDAVEAAVSIDAISKPSIVSLGFKLHNLE